MGSADGIDVGIDVGIDGAMMIDGEFEVAVSLTDTEIERKNEETFSLK